MSEQIQMAPPPGWPGQLVVRVAEGHKRQPTHARSRLPALLIVSSLLLTACSSSVTAEKISQIKPEMKPAEVEAILGPPASIEHAETTGLTGDLYHYPSSKGEGRVVFLNDTVFKAEFIPTGGKS